MSIAFIVDGYTEKRIIQEICGGRDTSIRLRQLNGRSVNVDRLCVSIQSHFRFLREKGHRPIVIIVDREDRVVPAIKLEEEIKSALRAAGISEQDFIVAVADQMIENWILAGGEKLFPEALLDWSEDLEGCNGKSKIKKIMKAQKSTYDEVTDGPKFFFKMSHADAAAKSPSFRRLFDALTDHCPKFRYAATAAQFASSEPA